MTDIFKDDETGKAHQGSNFKNKILADLQAASLERSQRLAEEERLRKERLAEAARKQEEAEAILRLAREEAARAEEERLEAERQAQLAAEASRRQAEEAAEALRLAQEEAARQEAEEAAQRAAQVQEEERLFAEHQAYLAEQERLEAERLAAERLAEEVRRAEEEAARLQAETDRQQAEHQAYLAEQECLEAERQQAEHHAYLAEQERLAAERSQQLEAEASVDFPQARPVEPSQEEQSTQESDLEDTLAYAGGLGAAAALANQVTKPNQDLTATLKFEDLDVKNLDEDALLDEENAFYPPPGQRDQIGIGKRDRKNNLAKKISLFVASLLLFILLAGSALGAWYVSSAIKPLDKDATEFVQVEIPEGSGNRLIGQVLEEAGVIKSGTVFNYYTKFKNYTGFQSGYYNFQKSMSLDDISKLLQEGGTPEPVLPALGKIVIPEGYTLTQIAKAVTSNGATEDKADKTPFKEADFLKVVQDPDFIASMVEKYPNLLSSLPDPSLVKYQLEGYLFPATYSYFENSTVESLAEEMLAAMDTKLSPYYGQIAERGMTVNEILSMAALVEKEGSTDDDRRQIASVFYNRMAIDMPLQSNIAILYAEGKLGDKTTLAEDTAINTEIDSPYNIYTQTGLTPGPVDSPSLSAIEASIDPTKTDYLYFVADVTTGAVYYAETFEDHNANVEKYVNSHLE